MSVAMGSPKGSLVAVARDAPWTPVVASLFCYLLRDILTYGVATDKAATHRKMRADAVIQGEVGYSRKR